MKTIDIFTDSCEYIIVSPIKMYIKWLYFVLSHRKKAVGLWRAFFWKITPSIAEWHDEFGTALSDSSYRCTDCVYILYCRWVVNVRKTASVCERATIRTTVSLTLTTSAGRCCARFGSWLRITGRTSTSWYVSVMRWNRSLYDRLSSVLDTCQFICMLIYNIHLLSLYF